MGKLFAQSFDRRQLTLTGNPALLAGEVSVDERNKAGITASPAGVIAYRSGAPSATRQFVWFDRIGSPLGNVGELDTADPSNVTLSPDGTSLAMHRVRGGNVDVWLLDVRHGALARLTTEEWRETHPVWSPDMRRIAFTVTSNAQSIQWSSPVRLFETHIGGAVQVPPEHQYAISADGQRFLMNTIASGPASPIRVMLNWSAAGASSD